MPTIRIDDEVWRALQDQAAPFVDTPNAVLRRVLGLDKADRTVPPKATMTHSTHGGIGDEGERETIYRLPILQALVELGGQGEVRNVLRRVGEELEGKAALKPFLREDLPSGQSVRWENRAQWERLHMVEAGLLKRNSLRGVWEITDLGREYLKQRLGRP